MAAERVRLSTVPETFLAAAVAFTRAGFATRSFAFFFDTAFFAFAILTPPYSLSLKAVKAIDTSPSVGRRQAPTLLSGA